MEMLQVGGHYLGMVPANNFMGHGFYQFSPELYYRVFNTDNGFNMDRMMIHESIPNAKWYEVADPDKVRQRVELVNSRPTYLLVQAGKVDRVHIFAATPQQSDYIRLWRSEPGSSENTIIKAKTSLVQKGTSVLRRLMPLPVKTVYRTVRAVTVRAVAVRALTEAAFKAEFFEVVREGKGNDQSLLKS